MSSFPYFFEDYLSPSDLAEGIDYEDPLGLKKKRLPTPEPDFLNKATDYFVRSLGLDQPDSPSLPEATWNAVKTVPRFLLGAPKAAVDIGISGLTGQDEIRPTGDLLAEQFHSGILPMPGGGYIITEEDSPITKAERGVVRAGSNLATDPMTYVSFGLKGIPGAALSGYFGATGIGHGIEQGVEGIQEGDPEKIAEALVTGGIGGLAAKHAIGEAGSVPVSERNPNIVWEKTAPKQIGETEIPNPAIDNFNFNDFDYGGRGGVKGQELPPATIRVPTFDTPPPELSVKELGTEAIRYNPLIGWIVPPREGMIGEFGKSTSETGAFNPNPTKLKIDNLNAELSGKTSKDPWDENNTFEELNLLNDNGEVVRTVRLPTEVIAHKLVQQGVNPETFYGAKPIERKVGNVWEAIANEHVRNGRLKPEDIPNFLAEHSSKPEVNSQGPGDLDSATKEALSIRPKISEMGVFDPTGKTIASRKYEDSLRAKYGSGWLAKTTPLERKVLANLQGGSGTVIRKGDIPSESTIEPNLKVEADKPVPKVGEYKAPYEDLESELKGFDDWKKSPELETVKESILAGKSEPVVESVPKPIGEPIVSEKSIPEVKSETPLDEKRLEQIRQELETKIIKQTDKDQFAAAGKTAKDLATQAKTTDKIINAQSREDIANLRRAAREGDRSASEQLRLIDQITKAQNAERLAKQKQSDSELAEQVRLTDKISKAQAAEEVKARQLARKDVMNIESHPIRDILGAVKATAASGDLGHIFRQGKQATLYLLTHSPKEVGSAIRNMGKQTFSEKEFTDYHKSLAADPDIARMSSEFGLDIPGIGEHLGEEAFHYGGLAERTPLLGKYVRASDRAYTSYMNSLRASLVKEGISRLNRQGFDFGNSPEKFRELARGINIITQRGDFKPEAAKIFTLASNIFWAPRAKMSRIQQLGEIVKPGESGRLARQGLAHTIAWNALLFGILKAKYGDKVEYIDDSERTDFGKFRIGNTTIDPWFGLGSPVRTALKLAHGKAKSSSGYEYPVSATDAIGQELMNGLAPGISAVYEAASGKDTRGYLKERWKAYENLLPLAARDIREIIAEDGLDHWLEMLMAYTGESINVFNKKEAEAEQNRIASERGITRMRSISVPVGNSKKKKNKVKINW